MPEIVIVIVLLLIALPLILSIVALVMASGARGEARQLREQLRRMQAGEMPAARPPEPEKKPAVIPSPLPAESKPEKPKAAEVFTPTIGAVKPPPPPSARSNLEVTLGGKVASFAGIVTLVLGIVFFVVYSIKQGWIGPQLRIILGLVSGGVLIALGHLAEVKGKNLQVLARVLTGGGAALMFFSVFAARYFYQLIGPWATAGGLAATSAAVIGLSVVYRSQTVAILGVLGAFVTPIMAGSDFNQGIFPLAYIAAVNASVMVLGIRRNWQSLYNIAFVFTIIYSLGWLDHNLGRFDAAWIYGLGSAGLYFAQFIALGLVKLKGERGAFDSVVDMGRMLLSSLLLMGALYGILDEEELNQWIGASFLAAALLHIVLVKVAWQWLPRFKNDILVLIAGAVTFATLALPAQLDGVWVSLGWAVEGLVLAWFAKRYKVGAFFIGGIALGLLGLGKALMYDLQFYDRETAQLFFNPRFVVSLVSAVLLGVQAWLWGQRDAEDEERKGAMRLFEDLVIVIATLGFIVAVGTDSLFVLKYYEPWAWLTSSVALAVAAAFIMILASRNESQPLWIFGVILLGVLPIKLLLIDFGMSWSVYRRGDFAEFFNLVFLTAILLAGAGFFLSSRFVEREGRAGGVGAKIALYLISLVSGILLVTVEISRAETAWKDTAVTLWWASCAMFLIFLGLHKGLRYLRYTALVLFGVTLLKVFLFDLAEVSGLIRVAAFMGVGVLLLVLSFTYQRIAPKLAAAEEEQDAEQAGDVAEKESNEEVDDER